MIPEKVVRRKHAVFHRNLKQPFSVETAGEERHRLFQVRLDFGFACFEKQGKRSPFFNHVHSRIAVGTAEVMSIAILENGESRTLEFKSELPKRKQLAQTVVAFANGAGELLIGVSDDCKAIGIGNTDRFEMANRIAAMIHDNCSPQIAFDTSE